jgi:hypothetical protein
MLNRQRELRRKRLPAAITDRRLPSGVVGSVESHVLPLTTVLVVILSVET